MLSEGSQIQRAIRCRIPSAPHCGKDETTELQNGLVETGGGQRALTTRGHEENLGVI